MAVKLCGEAIAHKTERGLVRLRLGTPDAVAQAAEELLGAATLEVPDLGSRVGALLPRDQWLLPAPDVPGVLTPP